MQIYPKTGYFCAKILSSPFFKKDNGCNYTIAAAQVLVMLTHYSWSETMSDEDENGLGNSLMKWTLIGAIIGAGFFLVKGNMGFLANLFVGAVLGAIGGNRLRWWILTTFLK